MPDLTFIRDDAVLHLRHTPIALPEAYRSRVDAFWEDLNRDGRFFNGDVLAATQLDIADSSASLELAMTDYAHYMYANQDMANEFDCTAVYGAILILTSDRYLLLGEMGSHTSSPGQIQCPGGGIELSADQQLDARSCCQRELEEEIGAPLWEDRLWFRPLCVKSGGDHSTVGLFYALQIKGDVAAALTMFESHQSGLRSAGEKPEFDRLHAVRFEEASLREFIETREAQMVDYLRPLLLDRLADVIAALEIPQG